MSSFFDEASLVMIPSGYKDQKVYSVKPLDGSGDLTFSRASSATRVASNGLIEKVRTNLILQSETFSNATWGKANTTFSVDTLTANAGTSLKTLNQAQTTQGLQTVYFDVAYVSHSFFQILFGTSATDNQFANFDVQNKVLGTTGGGTISSFIQDFGTYVRIGIVVSTSAKTNVNLAFVDSSSALRAASSASTGSVKVFRSQLETGDIATDYIATTTTAVSVGPVSGLPRLDYLNSSCPRLLLEPQRSNLVFFSEQLNNAGWAGSAVVTANTAVSPDGYTNADSVMESATTDFQIIGDPVTSVSGTAYTYSFFAKPNGRNFARVLFGNGSFPDNQSAYFNLLTGATSSTASVTASMVSYGNGWWRCTATCTSDASATDAVYFGPARNMTDGYTTYAGNASLGVYAYGVQQEAGAYATSYIPTLGTSVTRVADFANKGSISSLFGATEGTFFCELTYTDATSIPIFLQSSVSSSFNQATYIQTGGNKVTYNVYSGGSQQVGITSTSNFTEGQNLKIAIVYKANDFAIYINGVAEGSVSSGSISSSLTAIQIGRWDDAGSTFQYFGRLRQAILFPTRLSNSDLAALTA
jgi:hypothetical protein